MKSRRKAKKGSKNDDFELIKDVIDSNDVSIADIKIWQRLTIQSFLLNIYKTSPLKIAMM